MSKPREWWLDLATKYGDPCDFVSESPHEAPAATNIPVIEKSAYEEIKAENERLVQALERAEYMTGTMLKNYCQATGRTFIPEEYSSRFKYIQEALEAVKVRSEK